MITLPIIPSLRQPPPKKQNKPQIRSLCAVTKSRDHRTTVIPVPQRYNQSPFSPKIAASPKLFEKAGYRLEGGALKVIGWAGVYVQA